MLVNPMKIHNFKGNYEKNNTQQKKQALKTDTFYKSNAVNTAKRKNLSFGLQVNFKEIKEKLGGEVEQTLQSLFGEDSPEKQLINELEERTGIELIISAEKEQNNPKLFGKNVLQIKALKPDKTGWSATSIGKDNVKDLTDPEKIFGISVRRLIKE